MDIYINRRKGSENRKSMEGKNLLIICVTLYSTNRVYTHQKSNTIISFSLWGISRTTQRRKKL